MKIINLETKSLTINNQKIIDKGKILNASYVTDSHITFDTLETLYQTYKHSLPDNIKNKHNYFYALPYEKLEPIDLIRSDNRQTAKYNLEMAILTGVLNGSLKWPDEKHWFWQSKNDPDFIILRKWICLT